MVNYIRCFMMSVNKNRIFRNDVSCTVSFEQKAQKPNITIYVLCKRHTFVKMCFYAGKMYEYTDIMASTNQRYSICYFSFPLI